METKSGFGRLSRNCLKLKLNGISPKNFDLQLPAIIFSVCLVSGLVTMSSHGKIVFWLAALIRFRLISTPMLLILR